MAVTDHHPGIATKNDPVCVCVQVNQELFLNIFYIKVHTVLFYLIFIFIHALVAPASLPTFLRRRGTQTHKVVFILIWQLL